MEMRITEMYEINDGIYFCGLVPRPERESVPGLGDVQNATENQRTERLEQWNNDSKDVSSRYCHAIGVYTRLHLGLAQLRQEDVEE